VTLVDRTPSASRVAGIALVVALHAALVYAIVTGLAVRAVERVRAPIVTRIIAAPQRPPPAPPPPADFAPPPAAFVPPPAIKIKTPPPPPKPAESHAITAVTPVMPKVVAEPKPAPPHVPVRVRPRIDGAHSHAPDYPPVSRRLGEEGTVVIDVLVDPAGRAVDAKILQSSGFPRLDQAAIAGVKANYRFVPGTLDGTAQPMWYVFKFTWKLQ
jgi:periplasmic protein TonB